VAGFCVVCTPGHTWGYTSLLRDEDGLLFTGDAFGVLLHRIRVGVYKAPCADPSLAKRLAERLLAERLRVGVGYRRQRGTPESNRKGPDGLSQTSKARKAS
jgi:glyoxylase-like metal-dependent hydrolase (beta-lactamase superfamily II)